MDKQLVERIALEVCDGIPLEMKMHLPEYSVRFAAHFLARIDAERGKDAVAWLHESRREADVITTAVKNVWGGVAVGNMAAYSIPLFLSPTPTIPEEFREIYVGGGLFAMCDSDDFEKVKGAWWHLVGKDRKTQYAQARFDAVTQLVTAMRDMAGNIKEQATEIERLSAENRSMNEDVCHYSENEQTNLATIAQQAAEIERLTKVALFKESVSAMYVADIDHQTEIANNFAAQVRQKNTAIAELQSKASVLDGLSQVAIDGGWTYRGMEAYAKGLEAKVAEQAALIEQLGKGLSAVESLIDESTGVTGMHRNGDIALWKSIRMGGFFESWLVEFDEALAAIAAHRVTPPVPCPGCNGTGEVTVECYVCGGEGKS